MSSPSTATQAQYIAPPHVTRPTLTRTNRANCLSIATVPSRSIEVEELRHRVQLLLEEEYPLVLEDVADLALGIEHVAELARAGRTGFETRRIAPRARPLDAPRALL